MFMAKTAKKISYVGVGALILLTLLMGAPGLTSAKDNAANKNQCDMSGNLQALSKIDTSGTLDYFQKIKQELDLRKAILKNVIACAEAEAKKIKTDLDNVGINDPDISSLKTKLSGRLDEAIRYYDGQLAKVNDLGITGTQDLSKEILVWRQGTYAQLASTVVNLILWSNNQGLFRKAETRLFQIGQTVTVYKIIGNEEIQGAFGDAEVALSKAKGQNAAAKDAFIRYPAVPDTISPIKDSLAALADVYQKFFDVSDAIQKVLPH